MTDAQRAKAEEQAAVKKAKSAAKAAWKDANPAVRAQRLRVYPTPAQRKTLHRWMDASRWTYNQALAHINATSDFLMAKGPFTSTLRALFVNERALDALGAEWAKDTPYNVRDMALTDLHKAHTSNIAKQQKQREEGRRVIAFKVKFRSKKVEQQSLVVEADNWGRMRGEYAQVFGPHVLRSEKPLPNTMPYDSRIMVDRLGRWYLCMPLPAHPMRRAKQPSFDPILSGASSSPASSSTATNTPTPLLYPERVIALDPGCRTFMTGYDPSGKVVEWGPGDDRHLFRLCRVADGLQAKMRAHMGPRPRVPPPPHSPEEMEALLLPKTVILTPLKTKEAQPQQLKPSNKAKRQKKPSPKLPKTVQPRKPQKQYTARQRAGFRRAFLRVHEHIRNMVADMHRKCAKWLCSNYEVIVLPKFETKGMAARVNGRRKLHSKTARAMYTWSHYTFRQRLLYKATEYENTRVVLCTEEYTSKTCGRCGEINSMLGSKKHFSCPNAACRAEVDRDANGARNIYLKWQCT